ncbi:MAG: patatin family protein [Spirochaetia bacterium]
MSILSNKKGKQHALVVEGGAMRGIFAAGVLDTFIQENYYPFTHSYGVSAGASNVAGYLAKMYGRNYKVFTDYMLRKELNSIFRFLKGGHYMDLDWLWDITKKEVPLDIDRILSSPILEKIIVTNAVTGKAEYLEPKREEYIELLKASSAIPVFYKSFPMVRGVEYSDGGIADPIPAEKAWQDGAEIITVIRSRPYSFSMKKKKPSLLVRSVLQKRKALYNTLEKRPQTYNSQVCFLRRPPEGVEVREINPPEELKLARMTSDKAVLDAGYYAGKEAGKTYLQGYMH